MDDRLAFIETNAVCIQNEPTELGKVEMTPAELALIEEVQREVAECLGVEPTWGDSWVGHFQLEVEGVSRSCELYSSVLHVGNDMLHLMSHQVLDIETGKAYLVDYHGSKYVARMLRLIDPDAGKMIITVGITVGGVVQSTEVVDITFVKE